METYKGVATYYGKSRQLWRAWLEGNHHSERSVWLIIQKKHSSKPSVSYSEAVDEALCFGWIDSKPNKRDADSYYLFFARRNPKSRWSKVNKAKVERLIKQGLMRKAGMEMVEKARQLGTWTLLDDVEELAVPRDLEAKFAENPTAFENWEQFPRSSKRAILEWILSARKPETRHRRIEETVSLAAMNRRANHFREG